MKITVILVSMLIFAAPARADRLRLGKGAIDADHKRTCESIRTLDQLRFVIEHDPIFVVSYWKSPDGATEQSIAMRYGIVPAGCGSGACKGPVVANEFAGTTAWWDLPRDPSRHLIVDL